MFQPRTLLVCERKCTPYLSLERGSLVTVADPGEGPGGRPPPPPPPPPLISRSESGTVSNLLKKLSRKTINCHFRS